MKGGLGSEVVVPWSRTLALLVGLLSAAALAFGPRDALKYRPPELGLIEQKLDLAKFRADVAEIGLRGNATVQYTDGLTGSLGLSLDLDNTGRLSAEQAALKAQSRLLATLRNGIYRALKAHARLWKASAEYRAAKAGFEASELELAAARARQAGPLEIQAAENALENARLTLQGAALEAEAAALEARSLGLQGPAEASTLVFGLPPARPDRSLELNIQQTENHVAETARSLLALTISLTYQGGLSYRLEADSVGPSLTFTLGPKDPLGRTGEWRATVTANLRLDPAAWAEVSDAALTARQTRLQAEATARERAQKLRLFKAQARVQEQRMEVARKSLNLAKARLEAFRLRYREGLASELDLKKAERARYQAEAALAQAWSVYLDAVKAYLDLADGEWREQ